MNKLELGKLIDIFSPYGEFYVVGGFIRNAYIGRPSKDFDIATPMNPNELLEVLPKATLVSAAVAYPVVKWREFEIASFRSDGVCRRDSAGIKLNATIQEDAARRDFTMNAVYARLAGYGGGVVLDPTDQGLSDIKNKIIRFVGDPEKRIQEDPVRVFRALRFASTLPGFVMEGQTRLAVSKAMRKMNFA